MEALTAACRSSGMDVQAEQCRSHISSGTKLESSLPFVPWSEKIPTLGHNLALISVLYLSERPEMISHDEESRKAKTTKEIK